MFINKMFIIFSNKKNTAELQLVEIQPDLFLNIEVWRLHFSPACSDAIGNVGKKLYAEHFVRDYRLKGVRVF